MIIKLIKQKLEQNPTSRHRFIAFACETWLRVDNGATGNYYIEQIDNQIQIVHSPTLRISGHVENTILDIADPHLFNKINQIITADTNKQKEQK